MKPAPRDIDLVIPLYRERESLPALFSALGREQGLLGQGRVLFVDDASVDGSGDSVEAAIARGLPFAATLLRHKKNRGLTAALRTGFEASNSDALGWVDADLSYPIEIFAELRQALAGGAGLAISSPWHPEGEAVDVPRLRVLLSRGLSSLYRILHDPRIYTWSGMVRLWRRELLARCLPTRPGHLGVTESLVRAIQLGAEVVEVPARLAWEPGRRSGLRLGPAIRGHLGLLRDVLLDRLEPPVLTHDSSSGGSPDSSKDA